MTNLILTVIGLAVALGASVRVILHQSGVGGMALTLYPLLATAIPIAIPIVAWIVAEILTERRYMHEGTGESVDEILARLGARDGPGFHDHGAPDGIIPLLRRMCGLPVHTSIYERLDGRLVPLTREERAGIAPIELEMYPKKIAREMMLHRQRIRDAI
jgi:hypothetical protein